MSELDQYSGFDRAAILLQVLGDPLALTLFNSIPELKIFDEMIISAEVGMAKPDDRIFLY